MEGEQMAEEDWGLGHAKSLAFFLNGKTIPYPHPRGEPVIDDNFYLIFNADRNFLNFIFPGPKWGHRWVKEFDTETGWMEKEELFGAKGQIRVEGRSLAVLRHAT